MEDDPRPLIICPRCGSTGRFRPAEVEENNSGCLIFLFGGFLPYLLYQSTRENMVICDNCQYVFRPATRTNKVGLVFVAVIFLLFGALIFYLLIIQ
jgi:hypothetical protein